MENFTTFFDQEEKQILSETERFHKIITHLRYEGKPTRGKNVKEAKGMIAHLVKTLKRHHGLQEEIIFPFLLTHIPKHESAIQFLRADHQDMRKNKERISLLLKKLSGDAHCREEDAKIQELGVYLICLVRHHIELEKKSIHKALEKELKRHEKLEIGKKITKWLTAHKNEKIGQLPFEYGSFFNNGEKTMNKHNGRRLSIFLLALFVLAVPLGFAKDKPNQPSENTSPMKLPEDVVKVIQERGLKPDDILGAVSTFVPSGQYDDYVMFASGGHSGQVFVIGLPSMRLLRTIAVFEPESWQGYGFGVKETPLINAPIGGDGQKVGWADTHHPALSETNGDYDGQFLFIGDKSHGRIAVIDLRDFETKQFADGMLMHNDHGGCFVTPNTEYIIEGAQYAEPLGGEYAPISEYKEKYRGLATFWKFDREKGRIDTENSFAIELPPYWQDLADAGKGPSDGWAFMNSFNTEMATGGIEEGNPPFEAGTTQRDMDYLHVFDWKKAEELIKTGKFEIKNGFKLISLKTAIDEGVLFFIPEPKSPHGVDVTPSGKFMVVAGKLDPHVTVYSFEKMLKAIEAKDFEGKDEFGVPIIRFDAAKEAQVELGLGPLHTQFDNKGYAYTSLFLESAVARWTLGDDQYKAPEKPWTLVGKVPVQFNIGHLATAGGDTVSPDGKYLVALNKWSVDRYSKLGPLLPQNLQLVDIGKTGDTLKVLYDMPMGSGEPHYAQIIQADKLKTWDVYPEVGWNTLTQSKSDKAVTQGKVVRKGDHVEIFMPLIRSHFDPEHIEIEQGQHVTMHLTNLERTLDATHGFSIAGFNIAASIEPGETVTIEFTADKPGVYPYYCLEFCSALHLEMVGYLMVKPKA